MVITPARLIVQIVESKQTVKDEILNRSRPVAWDNRIFFCLVDEQIDRKAITVILTTRRFDLIETTDCWHDKVFFNAAVNEKTSS